MRVARDFKNPDLARRIEMADEAVLADALLPDPDAPGWTTAELRVLVRASLKDPRPGVDADEVLEYFRARLGPEA